MRNEDYNDDDLIDEDDKEPEIVEEHDNLRLDPEAAKRYLEIKKAHEKNHEPKKYSVD